MPNVPSKITIFLSTFRAGGGERVMVILANALAERGHTVEVVVLKQIGEYEEHLDPNIRIVSLNAWRMLFSLPKLVSYLQKARPDVLLATDEYTHLLAIVARRLAGVSTRIILRVGNVFSELYARYSTLKMRMQLGLVRRLYKYADGVIANSQGVADDILALTHLDPSKVTVIFNPKPIEDIQAKSKLPTGHVWFDRKTVPVVVAVSRLRQQKNVSLIIDAFSELVRTTPARLAIVGSGRDEDALREQIRRLNLSNLVTIVGYTDNPFSYMGAADVFVSASLWEGLPNALMEAMVCGIPVIASDCNAGPRELLAPKTEHTKRLSSGIEQTEYGILTAVSDTAALVEALTLLLQDSALRQGYAAASTTRAQAFAEAPLLDAYCSALLEVR